MKKNNMRKNAFTLTEVMIVVVIIGLLAAIVVPNVLNKLDKAQIETCQTTINSLKGEITTFYMDKKKFPDSWQEMVDEKYLKEIPKDPWDREFVYVQDSSYFERFNITSPGPDGQQGTEDDISLNK